MLKVLQESEKALKIDLDIQHDADSFYSGIQNKGTY